MQTTGIVSAGSAPRPLARRMRSTGSVPLVGLILQDQGPDRFLASRSRT